jgi:hypothetical protein
VRETVFDPDEYNAKQFLHPGDSSHRQRQRLCWAIQERGRTMLETFRQDL